MEDQYRIQSQENIYKMCIYALRKKKQRMQFLPDVFAIVLEKAYSEYDPSRSKFTTWVFKSARWVFGELIRKHQPVTFINLQNKDIQHLLAIHDEDTFEKEYTNEQLNKIIPAINKLNDEDKYIIQSYYFNDMTLEEIAEKLGITKEGIRRRILKILEKLKYLMI